MLEVGDFKDYVDAGLAILAAGLHVTDVGVGVADYGGDLFQHAEAVVAEQGEFYGIGNGLAVSSAGPEHVDAAVGFVEKVGDVGAVNGVDGNAFAAGDVADDGLAANGVATAGAIDEQIAASADDDGVGVSAKDAAEVDCRWRSRGTRLLVRYLTSAAAPAGANFASTWRAEYLP